MSTKAGWRPWRAYGAWWANDRISQICTKWQALTSVFVSSTACGRSAFFLLDKEKACRAMSVSVSFVLVCPISPLA